MKMPDGGWRPTYTLQGVSDTRLIAGIAVETSGSDMRPMDDALKATYARRPRDHLRRATSPGSTTSGSSPRQA
jgi:hypothetical protein